MSDAALHALPWEELEAGGSNGVLVADLCRQFHECGFCILRLPDSLVDDIAALREAAGGFFSLAPALKAEIGDFRRVADTYVGYRANAECHSEFLEMHLTPEGTAYPEHQVGIAAVGPRSRA
eukprot:3052865-Prymnesium_polylepis.1